MRRCRRSFISKKDDGNVVSAELLKSTHGYDGQYERRGKYGLPPEIPDDWNFYDLMNVSSIQATFEKYDEVSKIHEDDIVVNRRKIEDDGNDAEEFKVFQCEGRTTAATRVV